MTEENTCDFDSMEYRKEFVRKVHSKEISFEEAFQILCNNGFCPNLINNDEGGWVVSFEGIQSVVDDSRVDSQYEFSITNKWHDTIHEALVDAVNELV